MFMVDFYTPKEKLLVTQLKKKPAKRERKKELETQQKWFDQNRLHRRRDIHMEKIARLKHRIASLQKQERDEQRSLKKCEDLVQKKIHIKAYKQGIERNLQDNHYNYFHSKDLTRHLSGRINRFQSIQDAAGRLHKKKIA